MIRWLTAKRRRFHRDEGGAALIFVTMAIPLIFAVASISVDLGYIFYIKSRLQTAADLGALAGGKKLITDTETNATALATKIAWKNLPSTWNGLTTQITTQVDATAACLSTAPFSSTDCNFAKSNKNAIRVTATASTPLFFASLFGMRTTTFSATSLVGGGNTPPLDIVVIVDSTGSMSDPCSTDPTLTKLECAKKGVRSMLSTLWPSTAMVSLMTYPGLNSDPKWLNYVTCKPDGNLTGPTVSNGNRVNPNVGGVQWYDNSPTYMIVSNSVDYRLNPNSVPPGDLDTDSLLMKAAGGGTGSCENTFRLLLDKKKKNYKDNGAWASNINSGSKNGNQAGFQSVGGVGTYFAPVLTEAQTKLVNDQSGRPSGEKRQGVIIILSDGDAGASSGGFSVKKQCQNAIDVADGAAAAGTWIYSIAYDASTAQATSSCGTDGKTTKAGPKMSACETMRQVASDSTKFYSNKATCNAGTTNTNADLSVIFKNIAVSLMKTRRVTESITN